MTVVSDHIVLFLAPAIHIKLNRWFLVFTNEHGKKKFVEELVEFIHGCDHEQLRENDYLQTVVN